VLASWGVQVSFTLLRGGIVVLRLLGKAETTARAGCRLGDYLCLTLRAEEVKELTADGTLGRVARDGRVANGAQVLPTIRTSAGIVG
jgi:hypothetical protein